MSEKFMRNADRTQKIGTIGGREHRKPQSDPIETAQAFWKPWITDYAFHEGVEAPMPIVLGRLKEAHELSGAAAQSVAQKALEATLDDVQQLQKAALVEEE